MSSLYLVPNLLSYNLSEATLENILVVLRQYTQDAVSEEMVSVVNKERGTFSVEMVRNLQAELSYATFQGKVRHIVLVDIHQSSLEAQNAMLKLLEEPPKKTQFWLITPHPQSLLPTITSRVAEISTSAKSKEATPKLSTEVAQLLKNIKQTSYRELIDLAEQYKDRADAHSLVTQLIQVIHQQLSERPSSALVTATDILLRTQQHLAANVSPRTALEHCFFSFKAIPDLDLDLTH